MKWNNQAFKIENDGLLVYNVQVIIRGKNSSTDYLTVLISVKAISILYGFCMRLMVSLSK